MQYGDRHLRRQSPCCERLRHGQPRRLSPAFDLLQPDAYTPPMQMYLITK